MGIYAPEMTFCEGCPYRKFRPSLFTGIYVHLPDHGKPSQMWALSRKRPQEAARRAGKKPAAKAINVRTEEIIKAVTRESSGGARV